MPTTTIVVPGEPSVGPGSQVLIATDLIGPIPADWIWELEISVPGEEVFVWKQRGGAFGLHSKLFTLGVEGFGSTVQEEAQLFVANETSVSVRGRLVDASLAVQSDGTRTDLLWTTQGNPLREVIKERDPPSGLTAGQQLQLAAASSNTGLSFPTAAGGLLQTAVSALITHPPIGALRFGLDPVTLTGRGSLTRPLLGLNVFAFGAKVSFFTVPSGFGFRDGALPEYSERIVQLATYHRLIHDAEDILTEFVDINVDGYVWFWTNPLPQFLRYDVTPGCVVILQWVEV